MKLTLEEKRIKISAACGKANLWHIMKHGLYFRPDAHGYTSSRAEAWVVSEDEAKKWEYKPAGYPADHVTIFPVSPPDYFNCLNACHEMENWLRGTEEEYRTVPAIQQRWKSYEQALLQYFGISATAQERAELFGVVMKLWDWGQVDLHYKRLCLPDSILELPMI